MGHILHVWVLHCLNTWLNIWYLNKISLIIYMIVSYFWNEICTLIFIFFMLISVTLLQSFLTDITEDVPATSCSTMWHHKITLIEFRNYSQYSPSLRETFLKNSRKSKVIICVLRLLYKNLSRTSNSDISNASLIRFVINFYLS